MTAQKMTAQEIIAFIGNAEKKTNVKVTFEGELTGELPSSVVKLGNVLFGDWKEIEPLLANLTENQAKSDILCDLLTHNMSLFYFYTSEEQSKQNFFNPDCKFSCNAEESRYYCEIISKTWGIADKGHNPFVFCDLVSFWTEHWHLIYIRYP